MFKEIISISKNFAMVKVDNEVINDDLLNYHVVFEDSNKNILGEVQELEGDVVKITFLGEFIDNKFISGIIKKPSMKSIVRNIKVEELNMLVEEPGDKNIVLGLSPLYNDYKINIDINNMFSNHSAIFGNTGSGKTYGVAKIVQNLFSKSDIIPFNANLFIFNSSDEYHNSFKEINTLNHNFHYKILTTNTNQNQIPLIKIPLWHLEVDDFANILDVTDYSQLNILEKMLSLVSVFARNDENSLKYKNHLIASAIISVLYTNQVSAKIRDQIFSILTNCHTKELNLDVQIPGIGYTRQLRKCFDIDSQGDFVERLLVTQYIEQFVDSETKWSEDYVPIYFTLEDLEIALNFVLISEGLLLNEKYYAEAVALKVKLHTLANSSSAKFFKVDNFISLNQFMTDLVVVEGNKRCQPPCTKSTGLGFTAESS